MASGITILIGPQELTASLSRHPGVQGTELLIFPEARVPEAVEHIIRHRPGIVALPQEFAQNPRGVALASRITADPRLAGTQVLMIGNDGMAVAVSPAHKPASHPLDMAGTRRAPRVRMRPGITVQVDGVTAVLVDLSTMGAQVVSPTVLKPTQRVRLILPTDTDTIRAIGKVAWAFFEIPKGGFQPQYRAGLEFSGADPEPLLKFCLAEADEPPAR
jgi:hypothetical protein